MECLPKLTHIVSKFKNFFMGSLTNNIVNPPMRLFIIKINYFLIFQLSKLKKAQHFQPWHRINMNISFLFISNIVKGNQLFSFKVLTIFKI